MASAWPGTATAEEEVLRWNNRHHRAWDQKGLTLSLELGPFSENALCDLSRVAELP